MGNLTTVLSQQGRFKESWMQKERDLVDVESVMPVRYKPENLDSLCKKTMFSRKELQLMYRGFKQECPSGLVTEETFKTVYSQFFPQGDASLYAHFVFGAFDQDHNGVINFEEFIQGLSNTVRGSRDDKLHWVFTLYDVNNDGFISKDELSAIIASIYALMGSCTVPRVDELTVTTHVEQIFDKFDTDHDCLISREEFLSVCNTDDFISRAICLFDTVI